MAAWKYIKGSEKDFEGAPEWATVRVGGKILTLEYWADGFKKGNACISCDGGGKQIRMDGIYDCGDIIAQRERVTSINDDRLAQCIDNVNHPKHYTQGGIECIDAIKAATVGKSGIEAVCVANVVKYLWRYEEKNGVEDVKKARWYLERLIEEMDK